MVPPASSKVIILGFSSFPGKSSLAIQFVQGQFVDHYEPTIENSNTLTIYLNLNRLIKSGYHRKSFFSQCFAGLGNYQFMYLICLSVIAWELFLPLRLPPPPLKKTENGKLMSEEDFTGAGV